MRKMLIAILLVSAMMVAASAFADEPKKPTSSFNGVNLLPAGGVSPVPINTFTGRPFSSEDLPPFTSSGSQEKGNGLNLLPAGGVSPVPINTFTGRPFSFTRSKSEEKGNGLNLLPAGTVSPVPINTFTGRPF